MLRIGNGYAQRIGEYRRRFFKTDSVFFKVDAGFTGMPFKF